MIIALALGLIRMLSALCCGVGVTKKLHPHQARGYVWWYHHSRHSLCCLFVCGAYKRTKLVLPQPTKQQPTKQQKPSINLPLHNHHNDNMMETMNPDDPPVEKVGRVVRLHFTCRAELPIGSFLRVTGSTLWAPGTAANDPADAAVVVDRTEAQAFPAPHHESEETLVGSGQEGHGADLYTSSVEMVTTPDEYPVWRTRRPVVIVLPQNRKHMTHHHYYRYLIVSPGGKLSSAPGFVEEDDEDAVMVEEDSTGPVVSTSNEGVGSTAVIEWEDPFANQRAEMGHLLTTAAKNSRSAVSLASSVTGVRGAGLTKTDLRNLPYRTLDIDIATAQPESVVQDRYDDGEDVSFQHYLIREAVG